MYRLKKLTPLPFDSFAVAYCPGPGVRANFSSAKRMAFENFYIGSFRTIDVSTTRAVSYAPGPTRGSRRPL